MEPIEISQLSGLSLDWHNTGDVASLFLGIFTGALLVICFLNMTRKGDK